METNEKKYIEGFNNGYLLAKHEPVLLNQISKTIEPVNDYLSGFISGKEEYEIEVQKEQLNDLNKIREQSQDREQNLDQGI